MAKAHELIDNFDDNSIDAAKWNAFGNPSPVAERVREVNGRLEIRPRCGEAGHYSGYVSVSSYDLTSSSVHVELVRPLHQIYGAYLFITLEEDTDNKVYFTLHNGQLNCTERVAGTPTNFVVIPYDKAKHRWLRLREGSGTTYWEAAPDGETWTILGSRPNAISLTAIYPGLSVGMEEPVSHPGVAVFDNFNVSDTTRSRRVEERRLSAAGVRNQATELMTARLHEEHHNNNDETNYTDRPFVGNYSKSLKHDSLGDPEPFSYGTLLRALQSEDPGDFEEIRLASSTAVKLVNPQSGLAFEIGGADAQEITMPPAPRFDSEQAAHEMGELYWMALARDIPFINWPAEAALSTSPIKRAIDSLNTELPGFGGARPVTVQNLFRGNFIGDPEGPYVSQFLLKGNVDQRKPDGQGRDAIEGFVSYGAQGIDQRIIPAKTGVDYLTTFNAWLNVQNGTDTRGTDQFETTRRFITTLRDGATYVHFDQVLNAFYNAAWVLMSEPDGDQLNFVSGTTKRPQIDLEFPKDQGNFYDPPGTAMDSKTQVGFATFGPIQVLQVLGEVLGRALRAVWWQKWGVHRRLRPEEYGGRVHNHITNARTYPLHSSILTSLQTGGLAPYFGQTGERFPSSYLLPQAYPEGAPTHPAYGAGHATGAAACATILKAFFDESKVIENPVQANATGTALVSYTGGGDLTVGGELNKLASNIALFRNAAGVHWRSDYTESFVFGEDVAIRLLQEMSLGLNEDSAFFELTRFDGEKIRIFDGKVALAR